MALKPCRECGGDVSTEAHTCPRCGVPNPTGMSAQRPTEDLRQDRPKMGTLSRGAKELGVLKRKIGVLDRQELIVRLLVVAGAGFLIGGPFLAPLWISITAWIPVLGPLVFMLLMLAFPLSLVVFGWAAYVWYQANRIMPYE